MSKNNTSLAKVTQKAPTPRHKENSDTHTTSPGQMELWLSAEQCDDANRAYNEAFRISLKGELNDTALRNALSALPIMHSSLRGAFSEDGKQFIITPPHDEPVLYIDCTYTPEGAGATLNSVEEDYLNLVYDLEKGPLYRFTLVKIRKDYHELFLGAHHTVCDGWSLDVILADLANAYSAMIGYRPFESPQKPQFSDYVRARSSPDHKIRQQKAIEFWRQTYSEPPKQLDLPHDRRRPAARSYRACCVTHTIEPAIKQIISEFTTNQNLSIFTVLYSALITLIHKISGADDFVVGVPVAQHPSLDLENCVGHLVNLIPIRNKVNQLQSFTDLCRETAIKLLDAQEHSSVSFGEILDNLSLPRDPSRVPLIPITFTHVHKYSKTQLQFGKLDVDYGSLGRAFETFEFSLNAIQSEHTILLKAIANSDLISENWMLSRLREISSVLEQAVKQPNAPISTLEIVPPEELQVIERFSKGNRLNYDCINNVVKFFEENVLRTPGKRAITFKAEIANYEELNQLANAFANALTIRGAAPGDFIGICLERSINMLAAVLGIMKAGCSFIPLDPSFPQERLEYIIEHSKLKLVVSSENLATVHRQPDSAVVLAEIVSTEKYGDQNFKARDINDTHPAYVLYTSGSTGKPKGVSVPHSALQNFLLSMQKQPGILANDKLLAVTTLSFDISILELLLPLVSGAEVVLASREEAMDALSLSRIIDEQEITYLQATPATWRMLIQSGWQGHSNLKALCGGEALAADLAQSLSDCVGELWNMYGPTETTIWSSCARIKDVKKDLCIGSPIANTAMWVLNESKQICPLGVPGELYIGGDGLAQEYLHNSELTQKSFITHDLLGNRTRLYKTGDLVKLRFDGRFEYIGRTDFQVKIRGYRIELGEIENNLSNYDEFDEVVVVALPNNADILELVCFYRASNNIPVDTSTVRAKLLDTLPVYMVPQYFVEIESLPLTPNGKVDRKALSSIPRTSTTSTPKPQQEKITNLQSALKGIWEQALGIKNISILDNFFDLGGTSLQVMPIINTIKTTFSCDLTIGEFFSYTSVAKLSNLLKDKNATLQGQYAQDNPIEIDIKTSANTKHDIAIVGMACRFPGANSIEEFWHNLIRGEESIHFFEQSELHSSLDSAVTTRKNYVPAKGIIEGPALFDADFFGINHKESEFLDPQQRILLELSWQALQDGGVTPNKTNKKIGVFAGTGNNQYYTNNLLKSEYATEANQFALRLANEKDFVATRIAHKLNLKGPAVNIQTACSTSLTAVASGVESLRLGSTDIALCGGASITCPQNTGYLATDGDFNSTDGHCRPFDKNASGTVFSSGAGMVALKRLDDALQEGDRIYAVINGIGVNNDGADKMNFMAPSMEGQASAITAAIENAKISPNAVSLLETHGTATPLGDPIELEGLSIAYKPSGTKRFLGSVKGNIGHLDAAAGIAGLMKAALCISKSIVAPSINFTEFGENAKRHDRHFMVNNKAQPWPKSSGKKYAGVSSFGVGGTNVHVILSNNNAEGTNRPNSLPSILLLSAHTTHALEKQCATFANYCADKTPEEIADLACELSSRRAHLKERRFIVVGTHKPSRDYIQNLKRSHSLKQSLPQQHNPLVFMFPGQGSQYLSMGGELYEKYDFFKQTVDNCAQILFPIIHFDIRNLLCNNIGDSVELQEKLDNTYFTQPTLFTLSYSFAKLWMEWGLNPNALIGYSFGEYVAATLADIFTLEEGLLIVAKRAELLSKMPRGAMYAVKMPIDELKQRLPKEISISCYNGQELNIIGGDIDATQKLAETLRSEKIFVKKLSTSHAFHSPMMEPALDEFSLFLENIRPKKPKTPIVSTITGHLLRDKEATDPAYWAQSIVRPVLFSDAIKETLLTNATTLLEIGPQNSLSSIVKQLETSAVPTCIAPLSGPTSSLSELESVYFSAGQLWLNGIDIKWELILGKPNNSNKLIIPPYDFDRKKYWIEPSGIQNTTKPLTNEHTPISNTTQTNTLQTLCNILDTNFRLQLSEEDGDTNFIEAGIDSLALTRLTTLVQDNFEIEVGLQDLVGKYSSLNTLATFIDAARLSKGLLDDNKAPLEPQKVASSEFSSIELLKQLSDQVHKLTEEVEALRQNHLYQALPEDKKSYKTVSLESSENIGKWFPVTEAQAEILAAARFGREGAQAFNQAVCIKLRGVVDNEHLRAAVTTIFNRHDALNIRFNRDLTQLRFDTTATPEIVQHNFIGHDPNANETRIKDLVDKTTSIQYDFEKGPLFFCEIIKVDNNSTLITFYSHHVIFDGWSSGLFLAELSEIYNSRLNKSKVNLNEPKSFREIVAAEEEQKEKRFDERALHYWMELYKEIPDPLELPTDRPRPKVKSYRSARCDYNVPVSSGEIRRAASKSGVTPSNYLLAILNLLLFRISGQTDIVVGLPMSVRNSRSAFGQMGHVTSLLPIRTKLPYGMSLQELLTNVQTSVINAQTHSQVTFGTILKNVHVDWDISRTPLIAVMFNYDQARLNLQIQGCQNQIFVPERKYSNFELELQVVDLDSHHKLECTFNTDLFDKETIEGWLDSFTTVLSASIAGKDTAISKIELLSSKQELLLEEWNNTKQNYPNSIRLETLIHQQISKTPGSTAVTCGTQSLTYSELGILSTNLSRSLQAAGVEKGDSVGLCLDRDVNMVAALIAVLNSGASFIPLDPMFPRERLAYIIEDSKLSQVISTSNLRHRHNFNPDKTLNLDLIEFNSSSHEAITTCEGKQQTEAVAYSLYTSGSTGNPKGVAVSHRALVNFLHSMQKKPGLSSADRILAVTTLSFDISLLELLLPLICGAELVLATHDDARNADSLCRLLTNHNITVMQATPATWRLLLDHGWLGKSDLKVLCGGESLPSSLAEELLPKVNEIWNMYGPTETTIWSTCIKIQPGFKITLGKPIANTQVYILNEANKVCPPGVLGEIYIGGDGVANGYLNKPDLTAERFIKSQDPKIGDRILYKTGDIGRWLHNGELEYVGRNDFQVKIRGYRIELPEIERVFEQHSSVKQCVVHVQKAPSGQDQLIAYVIPHNNEINTRQQLSKFAKSRLTYYMIPSNIVLLEAFPLTPNGKIDRKALPTPIFDDKCGANDIKLASDIEAKVAEIFANTLGISSVRSNDDFFALGGNSILATTLVKEINSSLGVTLNTGDIFKHTTPQLLAEAIESGGGVLSNFVVGLNTNKSKPHIYFICGIALYQTLAVNLGNEYSCFGIFVPEEETFIKSGGENCSIEHLANLYVNAIKKHHPEGQITLAGVSFGGLLAYEIARQMEARVEHLILLDTILPGSFRRDFFRSIGHGIHLLQANGFGNVKTVLIRKLKQLRHKNDQKPQKPQADERLARDVQLWRALRGSATSNYLSQLPVYQGRTFLIKASERDVMSSTFKFKDDLGWSDYVKHSLNIGLSEGDHLGILESETTANLITEQLKLNTLGK